MTATYGKKTSVFFTSEIQANKPHCACSTAGDEVLPLRIATSFADVRRFRRHCICSKSSRPYLPDQYTAVQLPQTGRPDLLQHTCLALSLMSGEVRVFCIAQYSLCYYFVGYTGGQEKMQVEIDGTFWKSAEVICLKIMDAGSGYRTPPEEADARNQVVAEIEAMTRIHLLGAERLELQYFPCGWTSLLRDGLMAALHLAREHEAPKLVILTGKEKFGELRIAFDKTGLGELDVRLTELAAWAAVQSRSRCAGTGLRQS